MECFSTLHMCLGLYSWNDHPCYYFLLGNESFLWYLSHEKKARKHTHYPSKYKQQQLPHLSEISQTEAYFSSVYTVNPMCPWNTGFIGCQWKIVLHAMWGWSAHKWACLEYTVYNANDLHSANKPCSSYTGGHVCPRHTRISLHQKVQ